MPGILTDATIELNGLGQYLQSAANGAAPKALNFTRSMKQTSVLLASKAQECFDLSQTPEGIPWLPLKRRRSGKRNKGARGLGAKPLRDTGTLMASMQGRAGGVKDIGPTYCEQGTVVSYAAYHQYGTRHIPAREFSGMTQKTLDRIADYVQDDLVRQLTGK